MKQSNFKHYNLDQSKRYSLLVNSFAGVDYTTQKFLVADNRAIDILNYIFKDNVIQKRNGIENKFQVTPYTFIRKAWSNEIQGNEEEVNEVNFNGIWGFIAEDNKYHIIAHIGYLLYEIKLSEEIELKPIAFSNGNQSNLCYKFLNKKCDAFVGGKKLWFLGGTKYVCIRFESDDCKIIQVENGEITPIPTTTISITYKNSISSGRQSLDNTNLMTPWRKNKLLSGTTKNETELTKTKYYEYTLDSPLVCENRARDMANFHMVIEERGVSTDE